MDKSQISTNESSADINSLNYVKLLIENNFNFLKPNSKISILFILKENLYERNIYSGGKLNLINKSLKGIFSPNNNRRKNPVVINFENKEDIEVLSVDSSLVELGDNSYTTTNSTQNGTFFVYRYYYKIHIH